jgi:preprotein translocase SecE subunit
VGRDGYAGAHDQHEETPTPLEHATPDVELANAQLALGRPELADEVTFDENEPVEEELAEDESEAYDGAAGGGTTDGDGGDASGGGGDLVPASAGSPGRRRLPGNRLITFLQGSWRELQRVQWPDRQQVMQATGVVIGFVIVAGVFLGLADLVAGKFVTLILK